MTKEMREKELQELLKIDEKLSDEMRILKEKKLQNYKLFTEKRNQHEYILAKEKALESETLESKIDLFILEVRERTLQFYKDAKELKRTDYKKAKEQLSKKDYSLCDWGMSDLTEIIDRDMRDRKAKFLHKIKDKLKGEYVTCDLRFGSDGEFNGYVESTGNTVYVSTIIAGGWNIQKIHYRILVKEYK